MKSAEHKEPNYLGVFLALLILTLAEVGVFYMHPPEVALVVSLVAMALAKAGLVAAYFMHLRFEKSTLALIVISPLLLSSVILIGLVPDARFGPSRKPPESWVLPGHEKGGEEHPGAAGDQAAPAAEPPAAPQGEPAAPSGDEQTPPPAQQPPSTPATPTDGPAGT